MIKNLTKINPIKRSKIQAGMEFLEKENGSSGVIDKVIVFGSSLTDECTEDSDIDICLVSDYNTYNPIFFNIFGGLEIEMDDLCDIWIYKKIGGKLKDEIDKKGIVVYES